MSPGRVVAALAAVLACGAVVAVLEDPNADAGFAVFAFVLSWLAALVIAAVLLVPVVVVRRIGRPSAGALAAALVAGGLVTFPVYAHFYEDASLAAEGGGVGACHGILPLAQLVRYGVADETYGGLYYFASCND
jgi:hypothetical protein